MIFYNKNSVRIVCFPSIIPQLTCIMPSPKSDHWEKKLTHDEVWTYLDNADSVIFSALGSYPKYQGPIPITAITIDNICEQRSVSTMKHSPMGSGRATVYLLYLTADVLSPSWRNGSLSLGNPDQQLTFFMFSLDDIDIFVSFYVTIRKTYWMGPLESPYLCGYTR